MDETAKGIIEIHNFSEKTKKKPTFKRSSDDNEDNDKHVDAGKHVVYCGRLADAERQQYCA